MPDLKEMKIADSLATAKVGELVEVGKSELIPVDSAGVPVVDIADAVGIIAREATVQGKHLTVQGLLAKREQLTAELARVNECLKAVGR